jgi:hypothetical protein
MTAARSANFVEARDTVFTEPHFPSALGKNSKRTMEIDICGVLVSGTEMGSTQEDSR